MRKKIGYLLVASPFIGVAIAIVKTMGFLAMLGIFGLTALIVGVISLGCYLIDGNRKKKEVV